MDRGKAAEYHNNRTLDQQRFAFTGLTANAVLAEIKSGKSDFGILTWINAQTCRQAFTVVSSSSWTEQFGPGSAEGHE